MVNTQTVEALNNTGTGLMGGTGGGGRRTQTLRRSAVRAHGDQRGDNDVDDDGVSLSLRARGRGGHPDDDDREREEEAESEVSSGEEDEGGEAKRDRRRRRRRRKEQGRTSSSSSQAGASLSSTMGHRGVDLRVAAVSPLSGSGEGGERLQPLRTTARNIQVRSTMTATANGMLAAAAAGDKQPVSSRSGEEEAAQARELLVASLPWFARVTSLPQRLWLGLRHHHAFLDTLLAPAAASSSSWLQLLLNQARAARGRRRQYGRVLRVLHDLIDATVSENSRARLAARQAPAKGPGPRAS